MAISGDGKRIVSGGYDGTVRVWNLESMTCEKRLLLLAGIDIFGVDLSEATITSEELKEILRQNGAFI